MKKGILPLQTEAQIETGKILTISVAAYNVAEYIAATLDSCIIDNMDLLDVIIVDDGATDSTATIAIEFSRRYPHTFRVIRKKNAGYGSTINKSLELAAGRYFKVLDGDDRLDSKALNQYVEQLKSIDADMSIAPYRVVREDGKLLRTHDQVAGDECGVFLLKDIEIPNLLSMYSVAFKTDLIRRNGLNITENCFYTDSEYATVPLAWVESAHIFRSPLYQYRVGRAGQSMSKEGMAKHYKDHEMVFWKLFRVREDLKRSNRVVPEAYNRRLVHEAAIHYQFLCMLPINGVSKREMLDYDARLWNQAPDIAEAAMRSHKKVRTLRAFRFAAYRPAAYYLKRS